LALLRHERPRLCIHEACTLATTCTLRVAWARRPTGRDHSLPLGPGRAAPPICSDLIYDGHRWKSRRRGGRPTVAPAIRKLIREMSIANPLWGAPRIHGELLKLGIDIGQISVAKYMARRRDPPSQGWRTFLRNHADGIAAMDMFVVPTISFRLLYGLLIVGHGRRQILWFGVTAHPTAICPDLIYDRHRHPILATRPNPFNFWTQI
jgi:hypothetical protein